MIKLHTRTVTTYKCDFCNHKYVIQKRGLEHEFKCYKNPDRHCLNCDDTGEEAFDFGRTRVDCSSCKIAEVAGGRSFIVKHLS